MVVALITGVRKLVPVRSDVPPVAAEYQLIIPALAVAPRVTCPGPHLSPGIVLVISGMALTVKRYVAVAASQGEPRGLFVVTVIVTVVPISAAAGVYVNENGDAFADGGLTLPAPLSVIVTSVALPPKVLSVTVTGVVPQVLPLTLLNAKVGPLTQPHDTSKLAPVVVQPSGVLTVIV